MKKLFIKFILTVSALSLGAGILVIAPSAPILSMAIVTLLFGFLIIDLK